MNKRVLNLALLNAGTIIICGLTLALKAVRSAMEVPAGNDPVLQAVGLAAAAVAVAAVGGFAVARALGSQQTGARAVRRRPSAV